MTTRGETHPAGEGQTPSEATAEELFFFGEKPGALALYLRFKKEVLAKRAPVHIRVQKTQITFANRHVFGAVSFLPVRKAALRPANYMVVTFGLNRQVIGSPRIDAAVEPYHGRWTHHVLISKAEEIDDQLLAWVREAYDFAANKR